MKRLKVAFFVLILVFSIFPAVHLPITFAEGWLTGWSYRKSHVINYAAGAGTNYQVKITCYYGSGSDNGGTVYLFSYSRTDFGDVRFTDDDGTTLLDYWMETKVDSNYAVFWVEVADDLSTVAATIYIYYGNAAATTTSNLNNTFLRIIDTTTPTKLALPLNEGSGTTAYDKSGNNNSGTINGAAWTDGKYGKALSFDGVDDYVETLSSINLNLLTSAFTFSAWVNASYRALDPDYGSWNIIGHFPDIGFSIAPSSTSQYCVISWVSAQGNKLGAVNFDEWHHIAVVYTGFGSSERKTYIDGVLVGNGTLGTASDSSGTVKIGNNPYTSVPYGLIDEVRIYNRALSADEISDIYNNYLFEVPSNSESAGKGIIRKYVAPEPSHGSWAPDTSSLIYRLSDLVNNKITNWTAEILMPFSQHFVAYSFNLITKSELESWLYYLAADPIDILCMYAEAAKYGIEHQSKIQQALYDADMLANGLPTRNGGTFFEVYWRGALRGYYWAAKYGYLTDKWNITKAYENFKWAVEHASKPIVLDVYANNSVITYGRFYDEGAQTIDVFLEFYNMGITSALIDAVNTWIWINNNLWAGDHYWYRTDWHDWECESGGFLQIALKLRYYYPTLGNISRVTTDMVNRYLHSGWLSPQWTYGSTPYYAVIHHNPSNSERRLKNTLMAWASILGNYYDLSSEDMANVTNLIVGYDGYDPAWKLLLNTTNGLYSETYGLFKDASTEPDSFWYSHPARWQASGWAAALLIMLAINQVTGAIAMPIHEFYYEEVLNIIDHDLFNINLTSRTLRIAIRRPGVIQFLWNNTCSHNFTDVGLFDVVFDSNWNSVSSATKVGDLPSNRMYLGEVRLYSSTYVPTELDAVFAYEMGEFIRDENSSSERLILFDSSKHQNYGLFSSTDSTPTQVVGKLGYGLKFDGNDYAWISDSESMRLSNHFTLAMWLYPQKLNATQQIIMKDKEYELHLTMENKIEVGFNDGAIWYTVDSATEIELNTWYFIVAEFDTASIKLYINNKLENTTTFSGIFTIQTCNVYIGTHPYNGNWNFTGLIDELQGYHRLLTDSEKLIMANSQIPAPTTHIFTEMSNTSPSKILMDYYDTGDDAFTRIYTTSWAAQSFTVSTFTYSITSVKLLLNKEGNPSGTFTVGIRNVDSADKPIGPDLTSGSIGASVISSTSPEWYEIPLTPYLLQVNVKYAIVVRLSGGDATNDINWRYDYTGMYTRGIMSHSSDSGSSWTTYSGFDHLFKIYANMQKCGFVDNHIETPWAYDGEHVTVDYYIPSFQKFHSLITLDQVGGVSANAYFKWSYNFYKAGELAVVYSVKIRYTDLSAKCFELTFERYLPKLGTTTVLKKLNINMNGTGIYERAWKVAIDGCNYLDEKSFQIRVASDTEEQHVQDENTGEYWWEYFFVLVDAYGNPVNIRYYDPVVKVSVLVQSDNNILTMIKTHTHLVWYVWIALAIIATLGFFATAYVLTGGNLASIPVIGGAMQGMVDWTSSLAMAIANALRPLADWIWSSLIAVMNPVVTALINGITALWSWVVAAFDLLFSFSGNPHLFSDFLSFMGTLVSNIANAISWFATLIIQGFTFIGAFFITFATVLTSFVGTFVNMWNGFVSVMSGGAGMMLDFYGMWAPMLNSILVLLAIGYVIWLIVLWENKGLGGVIDHVKGVLDIIVFIGHLFLGVIQTLIHVITSILEGIPF
ncbi:MAG: DUF2341 domain-containing protein [Candidatus Bathycorpusculaceae bacterium]